MTFAIWAASAVLLLFSLTPFMRASLAATDLPSHFVLQYAAAAAVLLVLALAFRVHGKVYIVLLLAYGLCVWHMYPFLTGSAAQAAQGSGIKLLQANVLAGNRRTSAFSKLVAAEKPDVIMIAEANSAFAALFREMQDSYPHQHVSARDNSSYGVAVLSRLPFERLEEKDLTGRGIPSVFFRLGAEGGTLDIVALHLANPTRALHARDAEMAALARWQAEEKPAHLVVAGDLNATPYCPAYKKMRADMKLTQDARRGRGLMGTWPAQIPFAFARIPIDHVLANDGASIESFVMGPDIGSDHLPTVSVIKLRKIIKE